MQILNLYGKIKTTMLSEKLGLCISNIPKGQQWHIVDAIKIEFTTKQARSTDTRLDKICDKVLTKKQLSLCESVDDKIQLLVRKMICVRPKGFKNSILRSKNHFCNPIDQIEYGEKFMKFLAFMICHQKVERNCFLPRIIYDTHFFHDSELIQILAELDSITSPRIHIDFNKSVNDLILLGEKIDNYIKTEIDFKKLDYIISSVNSYHERDYNAVHFMNTVNLLTLLLVHPKNNGDLSELVLKLPYFIKKTKHTELEKKQIAEYVKKLRNKIAHGAFKQYEKLCEQYAQKFMKNFWFDYCEYDRETWIISNLCLIVDNCLARILWIMLDDKALLEKIQYNKIDITTLDNL